MRKSSLQHQQFRARAKTRVDVRGPPGHGLRPPVRSEGSPVTATPPSPGSSSRCSITGALCLASPDPPPPFRLQVQFPLRFTSSPRKKTQLFSHGAATTAALNTAKQMRCARFSTVNVS
jgi:hypothetical protein